MTEIYVEGVWLPAAGKSIRELLDPTTRKPMESIRSASLEQRERALEAARAAHAGWSRKPAAERAASVFRIVDEIRQAAGGLAQRHAVELGQPLRECQDLVAAVLRRWRDPVVNGEPAYSGPRDGVIGDAAPTRARVLRMSPQALWPFWDSVLRNIAEGFCVVCELPTEQALTSLAIARCAALLPAGVLNVVTVEADRRPANDEATEFVFVSQDCYLDVAVAGAATLRLYNTGQRTGQSTRIHVEASVAYKFADRLHEYLAFLEAGDPRKPITDLGPLLDEGTLQTATERLGRALKKGALVKLGGREYQPWGLRGYFLQPTLLVEGVGSERVPHETIAGPVVVVSPTADIGAALRESVGTNHGPLRLSAFTEHADKLDRALHAASFQTRTGDYLPLVERSWQSSAAGTLQVELIRGPQDDWFPYRNRSGSQL